MQSWHPLQRSIARVIVLSVGLAAVASTTLPPPCPALLQALFKRVPIQSKQRRASVALPAHAHANGCRLQLCSQGHAAGAGSAPGPR